MIGGVLSITDGRELRTLAAHGMLERCWPVEGQSQIRPEVEQVFWTSVGRVTNLRYADLPWWDPDSPAPAGYEPELELPHGVSLQARFSVWLPDGEEVNEASAELGGIMVCRLRNITQYSMRLQGFTQPPHDFYAHWRREYPDFPVEDNPWVWLAAYLLVG